jgi:pimeloyl-ACP methyl ester carboxylesterase
VPGDRRLPPPVAAFGRFVSTATVDWSDPESVIRYQVDYARVLSGSQRRFDEAAAADLVRREMVRARDYTALQNHDVIPDEDRSRKPLTEIRAPTLVIHGTADPMFPIEHGAALAAEIPGARLLTLEGAGHGLWRADWEPVARAILEHTAPDGPEPQQRRDEASDASI